MAATSTDALRQRRDMLVWGGFSVSVIANAIRALGGLDSGPPRTVFLAIAVASWLAIIVGTVDAVRVWRRGGPVLRQPVGPDVGVLLCGLALVAVLATVTVIALVRVL